jgi:hypothetical protein
MNRKSTIVWGTVADRSGIVHNHSDRIEPLPGGGVRVERRSRLLHEPASAYGPFHAWPMPLRWEHQDEIGRVVALRAAHGSLLTVSQTALEPDELQALGKETGGLKFSTGTYNRRRDPLMIQEISLVTDAATVGLPVVRWYKLDVTKGNPPGWVRDELDRFAETEHRSRRVLEVHSLEPSPSVDVGDEYEQLGRELGLLPNVEHRLGTYQRPEIEIRPGGRIIAVEGRPVG